MFVCVGLRYSILMLAAASLHQVSWGLRKVSGNVKFVGYV